MMNSFLQRILLTLFFLTGIRMNQDAQQIQQLDPYQTELLRLVNAQRAKGCHCGSQKFSPAQPLSWNKQLEKASSIQAQFLAKRKALTHKGQDGLDVRSRLSKANYSWRAYAENIAEGYHSPQEVFNAWMDSPGHCKNIMGQYQEMAVVRLNDYWVQDFGIPKDNNM